MAPGLPFCHCDKILTPSNRGEDNSPRSQRAHPVPGWLHRCGVCDRELVANKLFTLWQPGGNERGLPLGGPNTPKSEMSSAGSWAKLSVPRSWWCLKAVGPACPFGSQACSLVLAFLPCYGNLRLMLSAPQTEPGTSGSGFSTAMSRKKPSGSCFCQVYAKVTNSLASWGITCSRTHTCTCHPHVYTRTYTYVLTMICDPCLLSQFNYPCNHFPAIKSELGK